MRLAEFSGFPSGDRFQMVEVVVQEESIRLSLEAVGPTAPCPLCHQPAHQVHSRYGRTLRALPVNGKAVTLWIRTRRFRCRTRGCRRKIFTERWTGLAEPSAQRSDQLRMALRHLAWALGGEAGARVGARWGLDASPDTLLRLLHGDSVTDAEAPPPSTPHVWDGEDGAWRQSQWSGSGRVRTENAGGRR